MFSAVQNLNRGRSPDRDEKMKQKYASAVEDIDFPAKVYEQQIARGGHFLHERPENATSWQPKSIERIENMPGVKVVEADFCRIGKQHGHEEKNQ